MNIDAEAIKQLAEILDETGLTEIEVADGERVIRVVKGAGFVAAAGAMPVPAYMPSDPAVPQVANMDSPNPVATAHPGAVKSPMVGTAYLQSEPGAPKFVEKGTNVKPGDTLLIIEAMKVMNPIKADRAGTVTQILIENGQPVEFGDVLLVIE
ncbi:MAG: acetyl-CoA carboxylase biotin carboxyl carrier protein [Alphaproteobacteria bacterium]|nr:acetyl-CoA carboxylase biotin carboxyl carrier protein [Alphaproteobacteria bacterium]